MISLTTPPPPPPPGSASSCGSAVSSKPPDDSGGAVTLGNFSKLFIGDANMSPPLRRGTGLATLGNFSKIRNRDSSLTSIVASQPVIPPRDGVVKILRRGEKLPDPDIRDPSPAQLSSSGPSPSLFDSDSDSYLSPLTPSSTAPLSPPQDPVYQPTSIPKQFVKDNSGTSSGSGNDSESTGPKKSRRSRRARGKATPKATPKAEPQVNQTEPPEKIFKNSIVFSYQCPPYRGPLVTVQDVVASKEQKHTALANKLISQRLLDTVSSAKNGIHVFADMSNIIIGFQNTLRAKYQVPQNSYMYPMPTLNIPFFNELLTRGRDAIGLNAGCSTIPGMKGEAFISELEELGYRVDLRNRQQDPAPGNKSSTIRYVESMVDETIQLRIAETVMEHFDRQGTLVIATGDAKPANFSDGFFAYAERALKMGWHVEVVSWSTSLSRTWSNPEFVNKWPSQFRIIDLDFFVDELFARYRE